MDIIQRVKDITSKPKDTWQVIKEELSAIKDGDTHVDRKLSRIIVKISACLLLFITITITTAVAQVQAGELYRWKDKDGNVYLSDTPPDSSVSQGEVKSTFASEEPVTAAEKKTTDKQPPAVRQKEVTIYTNTT